MDYALHSAEQILRDIESGKLPTKVPTKLRGRLTSMQGSLGKMAQQKREHIRQLDEEVRNAERRKGILQAIATWMQTPAVLQRNEHTRTHKMAEAAERGEIKTPDGTGNYILTRSTVQAAQVFVVRHNWAAAIGPAIEEASGTIRLPYPFCIFELMISGQCVLILAMQDEGGQINYTALVETNHGWWCETQEGAKPGSHVDFAWRQVQAVCVALDAEAATSTIITAPHKLNAKRAQTGKPAVQSFRIVDLAKRHKSQPPGDATARQSPRLHFRRGHWRHFETHKTWIKWALVGDPDLGYIDKQYRI